MKKKKGSTLVVVLVSLTALIITGTAIYSYVANRSKLNKNSNNNEVLETAVKSALSIGEYYLVNEKKYKNISNNITVEVPENYIKEKVSNNNFDNGDNVLEDNKLEKFNYFVNITNDNNRYKIKAIAKMGRNTKEESRDIVLKTSEKLTADENVDLLLKDSSGITILNSDDLQIRNSIVELSNSTFNINGVLKSNNTSADKQLTKYLKKYDNTSYGWHESYSYNMVNKNTGGIRSNGLQLMFGQNGLNINELQEKLFWLDNFNYSGDAILYNNYGYYREVSLSNLNEQILKNYSGAIIKLSDYNYVLLCNGNLNITGYISDMDNIFIYSTGIVTIDEGHNYMSDSNVFDGRMSIVANEGIHIKNSFIENSVGSFKITNGLKKCLRKFTK
ncbi:MAG: hypothetical protein ACRCVJ_06505 [Clostridium sp.]|uniref:hypothetical protein n=1 Tax=Clostridium sp. TaxID=1506 RepID=UPI003F368697